MKHKTILVVFALAIILLFGIALESVEMREPTRPPVPTLIYVSPNAQNTEKPRGEWAEPAHANSDATNADAKSLKPGASIVLDGEIKTKPIPPKPDPYPGK